MWWASCSCKLNALDFGRDDYETEFKADGGETAVYDHADRLTGITHTAPGGILLGQYEYQLDGNGLAEIITETLRSPEVAALTSNFLESSGQVVMEAEHGVTDSSSSHTWQPQTTQDGYGGEGYLRALPDVGALVANNELKDSAHIAFPLQISTPATYTVWVRGMASDAAGDSLHVGLDDAAAATADNLTGFQPNEWTWSRTTSDGVDANLDLSVTGTYTLNVWMREDGLRLDRLLLVTDTTYIPTGEGPAATPIQVITDTVEPGLTSHVIQYVYDDVYRLTDAVYTGDIEADYHYAYDPVGNMTAYTETVGMQTTRVTRFFDDANRLQGAFDYDAGTTSYLYDNIGNLTLIMPPGDAQWLHYGFDQRNLMISHTVSISGTNVQPVALFAYDGNGNRVQQTDSSGSEPVTTTYINDVVGLTQVLVADDGTEQIYNLFGLDLIAQDDGTSSRYMLADGLGSVRTEMVDGTVESVTTYDPYGNLLKQVGDTGTTYGYTGEQHDNSTGLLYLRARYYNPALRSFMGRDPWNGDIGQPQSINGFNYVMDNPINLLDETGLKPFPQYCRQRGSKEDYANCVRLEYGVFDYDELTSWQMKPSSQPLEYVQGDPHCWVGEVPYRSYLAQSNGYVEGVSFTASWPGTTTTLILGKEVVYDFAAMRRGTFAYNGNALVDYAGIGGSVYFGEIYGFRSYQSIDDDYRGTFKFWLFGLGPQAPVPGGVTAGYLRFKGFPDSSVHGEALYASAVVGLTAPIVDLGILGELHYSLVGIESNYAPGVSGEARKPQRERLFADIMLGNSSPVINSLGYVNRDLSKVGLLAATSFRGFAAAQAMQYAEIFHGIHYLSYRVLKSTQSEIIDSK